MVHPAINGTKVLAQGETPPSVHYPVLPQTPPDKTSIPTPPQQQGTGKSASLEDKATKDIPTSKKATALKILKITAIILGSTIGIGSVAVALSLIIAFALLPATTLSILGITTLVGTAAVVVKVLHITAVLFTLLFAFIILPRLLFSDSN